MFLLLGLLVALVPHLSVTLTLLQTILAYDHFHVSGPQEHLVQVYLKHGFVVIVV